MYSPSSFTWTSHFRSPVNTSHTFSLLSSPALASSCDESAREIETAEEGQSNYQQPGSGRSHQIVG